MSQFCYRSEVDYFIEFLKNVFRINFYHSLRKNRRVLFCHQLWFIGDTWVEVASNARSKIWKKSLKWVKTGFVSLIGIPLKSRKSVKKPLRYHISNIWNYIAFEHFLQSQPPPIPRTYDLQPSNLSVCSVSNRMDIVDVFKNLDRKFDIMYAKRAFVHWYVNVIWNNW